MPTVMIRKRTRNGVTRARHLATIRRALDRAVASDVAYTVGSEILDEGCCSDRFLPSRWTPEQVRKVVLAYSAAAPDRVLAALAHWARQAHAWVEWYDLAGCDEDRISPGELLLLPEREAMRAERLRRASGAQP